MRQSELTEDFKNQLDLFIEKYYNSLFFDDRERFDRLILPHIDDMKVKVEERIENILEDEVLSDSFTGE